MNDSTLSSSLRRLRARPADSVDSAAFVQGLVVGASRGVLLPCPVAVSASFPSGVAAASAFGASGACDTAPLSTQLLPTAVSSLSAVSRLLGVPVPFDVCLDDDGVPVQESPLSLIHI